MPSPFDITTASNTVNLDNKREGVAAFTVKNNTRRRLHASAKVQTQPPDGAQWLTILPPTDSAPGGTTDTASVRDFAIDGAQSYQVRIAVPMDVAPGSFTMKLIVADEVNPDDNFTESPDVVFTVREIPKPEPRPFPMWIIPAVIVALLLIAAIVFLGVKSANDAANANATGTAVALANARDIADTATATTIAATGTAAANQTETSVARTQVAALSRTRAAASQTAVAAAATQTAAFLQAQAAATQTALNVFLGDWIPVDDTTNTSMISALNIADAGGNRVNLTYSTRCPPTGNFCLSGLARSYTIPNVPFNPLQLAGGTGNTTMLIQPANNNQLVVTMQAGGSANIFTMRRKNRFDRWEISDAVLVSPNIISQAQLSQLQIAVATTSP